MSTRIGILGYGNLGRGIEAAKKNAPPTTDENKILFMLMEDIAFVTFEMPPMSPC